MKPDWDKLMGEFAGHATALVADVDCTAGGKPLCEKNNVKGYPAIKFGDPNNLTDYEGQRTYAALEKFANENLKPKCGPTSIDLCNDKQKDQIQQYQAMGDEELQDLIDKEDKKINRIKIKFENVVEKVQNEYQEAMEKMEATQKAVADSGIGMMKAIQFLRKQTASLTSGSEEL